MAEMSTDKTEKCLTRKPGIEPLDPKIMFQHAIHSAKQLMMINYDCWLEHSIQNCQNFN